MSQGLFVSFIFITVVFNEDTTRWWDLRWRLLQCMQRYGWSLYAKFGYNNYYILNWHEFRHMLEHCVYFYSIVHNQKLWFTLTICEWKNTWLSIIPSFILNIVPIWMIWLWWSLIHDSNCLENRFKFLLGGSLIWLYESNLILWISYSWTRESGWQVLTCKTLLDLEVQILHRDYKKNAHNPQNVLFLCIGP
jgi:hypothetical protein